MSQRQRVLAWLGNLPPASSIIADYETAAPSNKRKRESTAKPAAQPQQLSSPPISPSEMGQSTPRRKRSRLVGDEMLDLDLTPRASDGGHTNPHAWPASHTPSSKSSHSSRFSPQKQLMEADLADDGLQFRQLNIDSAPESMSQLLGVMIDVSNGLDILPFDRREEILSSPQCCPNQNSRQWRHCFKSPDDDRGEQGRDRLPGRIPSIAELALIRDHAGECQNLGHDEAGWNVEVHPRILEAVFRFPGKLSADDEFNFSICTTAKPDLQFLSRSVPVKMVDFCVYANINSQDGGMWREAHRSLCRQTPTRTVNHTGFAPLQLHPIMLSIETKKPGKEFVAANLQMGVWHAAQWSFLVSAARHSLLTARGAPLASLSSLEQAEIMSQAEARVAQLPFLVGIMVQGHRWSLVISTQERKKTILWTEQAFGSTETMQGVFKVIAGLRELAAWSRHIYLPWWKGHVLDGWTNTGITLPQI